MSKVTPEQSSSYINKSRTMPSPYSLFFLSSLLLCGAGAAELIYGKNRDGKIDLKKINHALMTSAEHRKLQLVDVEDALCLQASEAIVGINDPGGLAGVFALEGIDCISGGGICDFEGTAYTDEAQAGCAASGGFLITANVFICKEDLIANNDIILANVPVCLDQSCATDTTYRDLLKALYDISVLGGNSDLIEFENTFEGKCAPIEIEWAIPNVANPYEDRAVSVDDTVVFYYGLSHNVYTHPSGDCSEMERILVGSPGGPASYTFQSSDAGKDVTFACDIGSHCEAGMIITFTVLEPTSSPTSVDSMSPSASPSAFDSLPPSESPSAFDSLPPSESPSAFESLPPSALDALPLSAAPSALDASPLSAAPSALDALPLSAAPSALSASPSTSPPSASPSTLVIRKFPKPTNKNLEKLKREGGFPNYNGIRGRARQLSHFSPVE